MKTMLAAALAAIAIVGSFDVASAQAVRPRWNYEGSAVCPSGYDYFAGRDACIARGGFGRSYGAYYGGGYGNGIAPRWNHRGSAVCPEGYDFHAHSGLCRPQ